MTLWSDLDAHAGGGFFMEAGEIDEARAGRGGGEIEHVVASERRAMDLRLRYEAQALP